MMSGFLQIELVELGDYADNFLDSARYMFERINIVNLGFESNVLVKNNFTMVAGFAVSIIGIFVAFPLSWMWPNKPKEAAKLLDI